MRWEQCASKGGCWGAANEPGSCYTRGVSCWHGWRCSFQQLRGVEVEAADKAAAEVRGHGCWSVLGRMGRMGRVETEVAMNQGH